MHLLLLPVFFLASFKVLTSAMPPQKLPPLFLEEVRKEKRCVYEGKLYMPREKFADESCKGWCACNGDSGDVTCVALCLPSPNIPCRLGEIVETKTVKSVDPTGRCRCKYEVCSPSSDFTIPPQPPHPVFPECMGKKLNNWFINEDCTERCQCSAGGISCVSLCAPMGVRCSPGMEKVVYHKPMDEDGRCTCKREKCVELQIKAEYRQLLKDINNN
ncbi:uncharacterized protein [Montipora capricornis]|uniref:uncharacterized protein n=1 Tax=Montipora foliosa TaxID=591990 RepID=UPI0035F105DF